MILGKIVKSTKIRVDKCKEEISFNAMKVLAQKSKIDRLKELSEIHQENAMAKINVLPPFAFENALKKSIDNPETINRKGSPVAFICEVKKASPSKGILSESFDYLEIAKQYEIGGAAAISVLTEPEFFLGNKDFLTQIKKLVRIPVLQKDFIIDGYQIYEASYIGADAILLICAILDVETIGKFIKIADSLGLSCLVETRNETEIKSAVKAGARVIGVNNRDLQTFEVDVNTSIILREKVPKEIVFVSESGIKTNYDVQRLFGNGVNAVLIGETLMKSSDIKLKLESLKGLEIKSDS